MVSIIISGNVHGLSVDLVKVEVDASMGLPGFDMGGILSVEVRESRERVKVAIKNSGFQLKPQRITVNISPADIPKGGTGHDLAIAVGCLVTAQLVRQSGIMNTLFMGELSLDGSIRNVRGVLPCILEAKRQGISRCIIPAGNAMEGGAVDGIEVYAADDLCSVVAFLEGNGDALQRVQYRGYDEFVRLNDDRCRKSGDVPDFCDVEGQESAVRASLIAAAGAHNILYVGPPGCGKTMMGERLAGILPHLSMEKSLEVSKVYSMAGLLSGDFGLVTMPPVRSPHHTISVPGMVGGGRIPFPGEITLSNNGVLFLDELTEYAVAVLESLRQPIEDRVVNLSRCGHSYSYPANFMLVATMNPCKCGFYPDRSKCRCTEGEVRRFAGRISKPLMDRFDMSVHVSMVEYSSDRGVEPAGAASGRGGRLAYDSAGAASGRGGRLAYDSAAMCRMVANARKIQLDRYGDGRLNSELGKKGVDEFCRLGRQEGEFMEKVAAKLQLSMRGIHKILKVARTIADLEGAPAIEQRHLGEAVALRR